MYATFPMIGSALRIASCENIGIRIVVPCKSDICLVALFACATRPLELLRAAPVDVSDVDEAVDEETRTGDENDVRCSRKTSFDPFC
jgi:hypothetical protein